MYFSESSYSVFDFDFFIFFTFNHFLRYDTRRWINVRSKADEMASLI